MAADAAQALMRAAGAAVDYADGNFGSLMRSDLTVPEIKLWKHSNERLGTSRLLPTSAKCGSHQFSYITFAGLLATMVTSLSWRSVYS